MERTRLTGGGVRAVRRTGAAADHGRHAAVQRRAHLRRGDEVDVGVDAACGHDQPLTGDRLGGCADFMPGVTPSMVCGLPALPMAVILPSFMPMSAL